MSECYEIYRLYESEIDEGSRGPHSISERPEALMITDEAGRKFDQILDSFGQDSSNLLWGIGRGVARGDYPAPWAIIAFKKEYKLAGHLTSVRSDRESIRFTGYSLGGGDPDEGVIPPVSMVVVFNKEALEKTAAKSEFLIGAWEELKNNDERRSWLLLADEPPENWLAEAQADDGELYRRVRVDGTR